MPNKIENVNIRDYQQACIEEILTKISNGLCRLTVIMTTGSGKNMTALFLNEKLNEIGIKKILYVFSMQVLKEQMLYKISEYGIDNVDVALLYKLREIDVNQYDCIFFFDLGVLDRKQAEKHLCHYTGITISFQANDDGHAIESEKNIAMVYASKKILDIRDAIEADANEKLYIKNEINLCLKRLQELIKEMERILSTLKENDEIKKLKAENERLKQLSQYQTQLLCNMGIPANTVKESFDKIQLYREKLKDEIQSDNKEVREAAIAKLQDLVADNVVKLTSGFAGDNTKRYETILKDELTEKIWNMLTDKSKSFLITAKINFASMSKMINGNEIDYSGVCLLVTKALEVEVTRRFYTEYKLYLEEKYHRHSNWPFPMLKRNTEIPIEESEFTLGSVVSVMGITREYQDGTVSGYHKGNRRTYDEFINFVKVRLFNNIPVAVIQRKLEEDYIFIEKVRIDYRNPSAHRDELTIISALACLDYVIDTQKKLKEMLVDMKF